MHGIPVVEDTTGARGCLRGRFPAGCEPGAGAETGQPDNTDDEDDLKWTAHIGHNSSTEPGDRWVRTIPGFLVSDRALDYDQRPHHVVLFVLQNVAVPDILIAARP